MRMNFALAACRFVVLALAISSVAGCDSKRAAAPSASEAPASARVSVRLPDGSDLDLAAHPVRILPTTTAAAEFLVPLVGATRLAALPEQVDDYSNVDFKRDGLGALPRFARYVAEPLIVFHPDLVVTHAWQSMDTTQVLRSQKIPVLVLASATSYADIQATLRLLGRVCGVEAEAEAVITDLDRRIARLKDGASAREGLRVLAYSNDGSGGWTAGSDTTVHTLCALVGVRNAAAEAGIDGHKSLDFEQLITIDPDVVVVATPVRGEGGSATKNVLVSTPALARLAAVQQGRIAVISGALMSSDSPSLVDAAEALAAELDRIGATRRKP
jgi:iron complex transport system substrate-binding protein